MSGNDWRLQGQEAYLTGARLSLRRWTARDARWDHDHCEFCWATFSPAGLDRGYTTADEYRWICERCFSDFRAHFGWTVLPEGATGEVP
jgi:hypothetical protein